MLNQMEEERAFRSLKPQPQSTNIPIPAYFDSIAPLAGWDVNLDKLKETDPESYAQFVQLPMIQFPNNFCTHNVNEIIK